MSWAGEGGCKGRPRLPEDTRGPRRAAGACEAAAAAALGSESRSGEVPAPRAAAHAAAPELRGGEPRKLEPRRGRLPPGRLCVRQRPPATCAGSCLCCAGGSGACWGATQTSKTAPAPRVPTDRLGEGRVGGACQGKELVPKRSSWMPASRGAAARCGWRRKDCRGAPRVCESQDLDASAVGSQAWRRE